MTREFVFARETGSAAQNVDHMKTVISKHNLSYTLESMPRGTPQEVLYGGGMVYHLHCLCNWDVPMYRQLPQLLLGAENGPFEGDKGAFNYLHIYVPLRRSRNVLK